MNAIVFGSLPTLTTEQLGFIVQRVHAWSGITMRSEQKSMLEGRLRKRLRALDLPDFSAYCALLRDVLAADRERLAFLDAVTTNETSFFRTERIWRFLADSVLPAHRSGVPFQVWSAASSIGCEIYSFAALAEEERRRRADFEWSGWATDLSPAVLANAAEGIFPEAQFRSWKPALGGAYDRLFELRPGGAWQVAARIRRKLIFRQHNLFEPAPHGGFDLVFLRNVLIYFDRRDKQRVVDQVLQAVKPGGWLILGETESLLGGPDALRYVAPGIYSRDEEGGR